MTETERLLTEYVTAGSEPAFRELVARYIDLVYSTAIRQAGGDRHLAEDVAQTVFLNLARKAHRLPPNVMLGGWLYQDTCNVAATLLRSERRRVARERQAVQMNKLSPNEEGTFSGIGAALDEAISNLDAEDRAAILLRFFEQCDFRSVGQALGTSEDAARMRVNRSLEKLHSILSSQGVRLSAAAMAAGLAAEAVTAAPAGMAASIAGSALAGVGAGGGAVLAITRATGLAKLKLFLIGTAAVTALVSPFYLQHQSRTTLEQESALLREQLKQLAPLQTENRRLSNLVAELSTKPALGKNELSELLRLRGEVGLLRKANKVLQANSSGTSPGDGNAEKLQFVYLDGEFKFPNRYRWTNGMTLAAAIELARGFTEHADSSSIEIRSSNGEAITNSFMDPGRWRAVALQPNDRVLVLRSGRSETASAAQAPVPLYTRLIRIDENVLSRMSTSRTEGEQEAANGFLADNGVNLVPPETVYIDPANLTLRVRASLPNLDKIEAIVATMKGDE